MIRVLPVFSPHATAVGFLRANTSRNNLAYLYMSLHAKGGETNSLDLSLRTPDKVVSAETPEIDGFMRFQCTQFPHQFVIEGLLGAGQYCVLATQMDETNPAELVFHGALIAYKPITLRDFRLKHIKHLERGETHILECGTPFIITEEKECSL